MKIKAVVGAGIAAGALSITSLAGAAVTFDSATGSGFVGKGDVQLAFGWNNKQLQTNLAKVTVSLEQASTTVTEVTWECTNTRNENLQERERATTATASTVGVVEAVGRDGKNQITGVNLQGWEGEPTVTSELTTDGPRPDSCPTNWVLTAPAGDPVLVSDETTGGLYASFDGGKPVKIG